MTKLVRKIRPADFWRIGEHESWFSDMAKEGLHFHSMGKFFARFIKGEPKEMEYRIEVTPTKEILDDQISMYEENGWDYISSFEQFHVFASPKDHNAVEIHTDPAEQFFTLQTLNKILISNLIIVLLLSLLTIGINVALWFMNNTPVLRLVEGHIIQITISSFVVLYSVYLSSKGMLAILALRRKLKHGIPINHHAPWKKSLRRSATLNIAFIMLALGSACLPFKQLLEMDTITLPIEATEHKVVRLEDLEQLAELKRDEYFIDGVNVPNSLTTNWSIVAPKQYEILETFISNDSNENTLFISSEVYELRMKSLVEPLVEDLIKRYNFDYDPKVFIKEQHASLNHLYIYEEGMYREVIAAKGNLVTFVRYYGNTTTDALIEKVAEKLNE